MRKGRDGEKNGEKKREKREKKRKKKIQMKIVATTPLPAVDRPNADRWKAAHSCQKFAATKWRKLGNREFEGDILVGSLEVRVCCY